MNTSNNQLIDFLKENQYDIVTINSYNNMFLAVNKRNG